MQVLLARSAGFCLGVSLALRHLDRELAVFTVGGNSSGGRLITFGPIIHNPLVMRCYEEQGVVCEDDPAGIRSGDRVVIRAHGIPREVEQRLREAGAEIIDATCPKVKKAQLAIAGVRGKKTGLLLFGESEHPEVRGLLSYARGDSRVFGSLEELDALDIGAGSYYLAAQTTQEQAVFLEARQRLNERLGRPVHTLETICNATRDRQQGVIELCGKVEAMVVVGGFNSGNTRRLAEVARAEGVYAVHVEQAGDFTEQERAALTRCDVVGLTAGASTPQSHIEAMQAYLQDL
jgi:4-hydroxy-3-methylbut-2-enyl diphosphate reductase